VRDWVVGGAVLLDAAGDVLLVQNRRRNGATDWTPPGGVIEVADGESVLDGLGREVEEETGLRVTAWEGLLWSVTTEAPGLGWRLRAEIHLAAAWEGDLRLDDPDGIVVDAAFVDLDGCSTCLAGGHPWVREPLTAWLDERWADARPFGYRVDGDDLAPVVVTRLP
jgi:ADP-ribose pyrophosphatase YjhB (NUDIX family)